MSHSKESGPGTRRLTVTDFAACAVILVLGMLQWVLSERSPDLVTNDVISVDLARSIQGGSYNRSGRPETLYPPVLALILLLVGVTAGFSHTILFHSMAVIGTAGLLFAYWLLRRLQGPMVAAAVCLLLGSSSLIFVLTTRRLIADVPFLGFVMAALLTALLAESAATSRARRGWALLFSLLLIGAILTRSAGVALLGGLGIWLGVSFVAGREAWVHRLKLFLPSLIAGVAAYALWVAWTRTEVPEWWMGSWPGGSYFFQARLKSGPEPDLGMASIGDIPPRVGRNLVRRSAGTIQLLSHVWIDTIWFSPMVCGAIALIVLGLWRSMRRPAGGGLQEWFFIGHEVIFLLWPWPLETRFLLPGAPLAGLYLWRGGQALLELAVQKPRIVGVAALLPSLFLGIVAASHVRIPGHMQIKMSAAFWLTAAMTAVWLMRADAVFWISRFSKWLMRPRWGRAPLPQVFLAVVLTGLFSLGIAAQLRLGSRNLHFDLRKEAFYPDIEAAQWLRANVDSDAVVMARDVPIVNYYSHRKTIWFAPTADPHVLMEGIQKHGVRFILVIDNQEDSYFLPPAEVSFARLSETFADRFRLVHQGPDNRIFEVR